MERTTLSYQQTGLVTTCYDLAIMYTPDYDEPGVLESMSLSYFRIFNVVVTIDDLVIKTDSQPLIDFFTKLYDDDDVNLLEFYCWVLQEIRDQINAKNIHESE